MSTALTEKEERFCIALAENSSGTEAYLATIARPGTKRQAACAAASKMLARPEIAQRVDELRDGSLQRLIMRAIERRVLRSQIARGETVQQIRRTTRVDGVAHTTIEEREPSHADRLAAVRALDEQDGILEPQAQVNVAIQYVVAVPTERPSIDEWAKTAEAEVVK